MKIVTYNIQYGRGRDGRFDLDRIADTVSGADSHYILSIFSVYSQYMYIPSVYSQYICSILLVYYRVPMLNTNQS